VRGGTEHVEDDGELGVEVAEAGGEVQPRASPKRGRWPAAGVELPEAEVG
jgi:hypothetical protein